MISAAKNFVVRSPNINWSRWIIVLWATLLTFNAFERSVPGEWWLHVRSVTVKDTYVGATPVMFVDRTIHRPFLGVWTAEVEREVAPGQFEHICHATDVASYSQDNVLPDPLNLDWWTYPVKCSNLSAGRYRVETRWEIHVSGGLTKEVHAISNVFEIKPQPLNEVLTRG